MHVVPAVNSVAKKLDSQTVEIIGRNRLIHELLLAELEVALPLRDRGIDLIAYKDQGEELTAFVACPIQMKAASERIFSIIRKYEKFRNLIHAFVWYVHSPPDAVTYALTHAEAISVGEAMGFTLTKAWTSGGYYMTSKPARRLVERLERFRMTPDAWRAKVLALQTR